MRLQGILRIINPHVARILAPAVNFCFRAALFFYALRLVNDDDRVAVLDKAHGTLAVQLVLRLVDDVLGLAKGVDVDGHDLDVGGSCKLTHIEKGRPKRLPHRSGRAGA